MKKVITFFSLFLSGVGGSSFVSALPAVSRKHEQRKRTLKLVVQRNSSSSFELKWLFSINNDDVTASLDRDAVLRDADRRVVARPLSRQLHLRRRQPDRDVHPGGTRSDAQHAKPQTPDHRLQVQQLPHDRRLTKVNLTYSVLIVPSCCPSHLKVPTELILPNCSFLS